MNTEQYLLPNWTLCPLLNDDTSGISEEEDNLLNDWINKKLKTRSCFVAMCPDEPDYQGFCNRNDLDNFGGDCTLVTFDIGKKKTS